MNKAQHRLVKSISRARKLYSSGKAGRRILASVIKTKNRVLYSCDIGITAIVPESCVFHHSGLGVVIGNGSSLGENCQIYSNVTIGSKELHGKNGKNHCIGNNVIIGAGAIVLGDINVGDNSVIGAGSIVLESVPSNVTVAGNPAKIIKK